MTPLCRNAVWPSQCVSGLSICVTTHMGILIALGVQHCEVLTVRPSRICWPIQTSKEDTLYFAGQDPAGNLYVCCVGPLYRQCGLYCSLAVLTTRSSQGFNKDKDKEKDKDSTSRRGARITSRTTRDCGILLCSVSRVRSVRAGFSLKVSSSD